MNLFCAAAHIKNVLESIVLHDIFLFIPVHMFSPSFLCLSVRSICGIVLQSVQKKEKKNMSETIDRKWESDGDEDREGRRREVNKQIPKMHNLIETFLVSLYVTTVVTVRLVKNIKYIIYHIFVITVILIQPYQ